MPVFGGGRMKVNMRQPVRRRSPRSSAVNCIAAVLFCLLTATWGGSAWSHTRLEHPRAGKGSGGARVASAPSLPGRRKRRARKARAPLVGNIKDTKLYDGCGCYFQFPAERRSRSQRYFFRADMGRRAWMNIAGEDVELTLVGANVMSLKGKKGERMNFRFTGPGRVRVRVRMLVTRNSTYETDYEPQRYAVSLEVAKGGRRQVIKTQHETCSC